MLFSGFLKTYLSQFLKLVSSKYSSKHSMITRDKKNNAKIAEKR